MNTELRNLADVLRIDAPEHRGIALAFGKECVARVAHLFELAEAHELYSQFADAVRAGAQAPALEPLAVRAAMLARSHPGSASIDGSGHSAVTATHALARALAGRAVEAAEYAAYALVYSYGRYAVGDPDAFKPEFEWQVRRLRELHEASFAQRKTA